VVCSQGADYPQRSFKNGLLAWKGRPDEAGASSRDQGSFGQISWGKFLLRILKNWKTFSEKTLEIISQFQQERYFFPENRCKKGENIS